MPTFSRISRAIAGVAIAAGIATGFLIYAADEDSAPAPQMESQQSSQTPNGFAENSVRKDLMRDQDALTEIVSEMKLNGLNNMDAATPSQTAAQLSLLGQNDLTQLTNALEASATGNANDRQSLLDSYRKQMADELQLKALAIDLAPREARVRMPHHLAIMLAHQTTNIRLTSELTAAREQWTDRQQMLHKIVGISQSTIEGEIDLLGKIPANPIPEGSRDSVDLATDATLFNLNRLSVKHKAVQATQLTKSGPTADAIAAQETLKSAFLELLQSTMAQSDELLQLREAKAQLDKIVADQSALKLATQAETATGSTLAERQAEINDRTQVAQILLDTLNPLAALQVQLAHEGMGRDSTKLKDGQGPEQTIPEQDKINSALADAERLLQQKIASIRNQRGSKSGKMSEEELADDDGGGTQGQGDDEGYGDGGEEGSGTGNGGDGNGSGSQFVKQASELGPGTVVVTGTLSSKDREALSQYQEEKIPPEYAPMVRQYQNDLNDQTDFDAGRKERPHETK